MRRFTTKSRKPAVKTTKGRWATGSASAKSPIGLWSSSWPGEAIATKSKDLQTCGLAY